MTLLRFPSVTVYRHYLHRIIGVFSPLVPTQDRSAILVFVDFRNPKTINETDFRNPKTINDVDFITIQET